MTELVQRAQAGDLEAFGRLVSGTQRMAYAVARGVVRDPGWPKTSRRTRISGHFGGSEACRTRPASPRGAYTDRIVRHLGADPVTHTAMGVGYGLERLAMLRFGIDDIRKVDVTRVA